MNDALVVQRPDVESTSPKELLLLFHGSVDAQARLRALGADATLDRFAGLAHGIDARVVECLNRLLS